MPFGRGIMPNVWSFYEGYPSGISIHELNDKFDSGKILIQKKINFKNFKNQTLKSTHDYLIYQLEKFFIKNVDKIFNNQIKGFKQDKFFKTERYHNRKESNKLMKKFKKKWNTKIIEVINEGMK